MEDNTESKWKFSEMWSIHPFFRLSTRPSLQMHIFNTFFSDKTVLQQAKPRQATKGSFHTIRYCFSPTISGESDQSHPLPKCLAQSWLSICSARRWLNVSAPPSLVTKRGNSSIMRYAWLMECRRRIYDRSKSEARQMKRQYKDVQLEKLEGETWNKKTRHRHIVIYKRSV